MRLYRTFALVAITTSATLSGCSAKAPLSEGPGSPSDHYADNVSQPQYPSAPAAPPMAAPASVAERKAGATNAAPQAKVPAVAQAAPTQEPAGTEQYTDYGVNPAVDPSKDALSTFAIDVDTASYAIGRSKIVAGTLPPFQSVRAEEYLNYFDYGYAEPSGAKPFAVHLSSIPSPYQAGHHIIRVGLKARNLSRAERMPVHLVYLVDTSGSMHSPNKLELAKKSLRLLTKQLGAADTVSLCTYAGSTRVVLEPTGGNDRKAILDAIDSLSAGGGTAMSNGMDAAYKMAERTLVKGHVNRVIVLSDGDANIGRTSHHAILRRIEQFKDKGITLSTVGFGRGNYKDTMMEQLANKGDGNYYYIDTEAEARKVFGEQLDGMLEVVARDVKVQVECDPRGVKRYRLIGYENRDIADRDFRNDEVDAGEIGNGHSVTALYDVVLDKSATGRSPVIVRLRHKKPTGSDRATELAVKLAPEHAHATIDDAPANLRWAAAVAGFAEILRRSPHARGWTLETVQRLARNAEWGQAEQREFMSLVRRTQQLLPKRRADAIVAE